MSTKTNAETLPEVRFVKANGPAYARIFFPDEAARRTFLVKTVPEGIRDRVEHEDFRSGTELPLGEHGTYDAWIYDRDPEAEAGRGQKGRRIPTLDVRDFYGGSSPERIERFRQFIFDHLEGPDQEQRS